LGDGEPTFCPFPTTTDLGLAGFLFLLLKPVLGVGGRPAIRQQGYDASRDPSEALRASLRAEVGVTAAGSSDIFHPYCDLYLAGLLGVVEHDPEMGLLGI